MLAHLYIPANPTSVTLQTPWLFSFPSLFILEVIAELYVSTFAVAFKLTDFWLHPLLMVCAR